MSQVELLTNSSMNFTFFPHNQAQPQFACNQVNRKSAEKEFCRSSFAGVTRSQFKSKKQSRRRILSSERQYLEELFKSDMFPSQQKRKLIADKLSMSSRTVQIWFQNRRAILRKEKGLPNHFSDDDEQKSSSGQEEMTACQQEDDSRLEDFHCSSTEEKEKEFAEFSDEDRMDQWVAGLKRKFLFYCPVGLSSQSSRAKFS
eukprot:TRINITY_DN5253_c0_g1_i1.p1 TRINITY_DN5253_c0_g1~~TRINITY_DN5253_c0_g1_i1.p1  ORF type:complete len:201 (-),score=46.64 TRINITY_DN5253_c0_g1_i1:208-810(-)